MTTTQQALETKDSALTVTTHKAGGLPYLGCGTSARGCTPLTVALGSLVVPYSKTGLRGGLPCPPHF